MTAEAARASAGEEHGRTVLMPAETDISHEQGRSDPNLGKWCSYSPDMRSAKDPALNALVMLYDDASG
jgi:hypothetical protein